MIIVMNLLYIIKYKREINVKSFESYQIKPKTLLPIILVCRFFMMWMRKINYYFILMKFSCCFWECAIQ